MKIKIADHYGLCFGVRDALAKAELIAQEGPITILGELVHNPIARARLKARGAREGSLQDLASAQTARVMITAHGAADAQRERWKAAGFAVSDTTCPLVRKAHTALRLLVARGGHPVVIGKRGHMEVEGLIGDFPGASVVESLADIDGLPIHPRYGIISQTTQPLEKVRTLVAAIRAARPESEVEFTDTVCQPTKDRQGSLRKLLAEVEVMVVVGGRNSNNTLQLVAACRAAGRPVHHAEQASELQAEWFCDARSVGLTAGTSTLEETVRAVHRRLEEIATARAAAWSKAWRLAGSERPAVLSSAEWAAYFRENASRLKTIPWELGAGATAAELAVFIKSLQAWQLGETSDGSHLLAAARHHAASTNDPAFVEAVSLFIGEEQRHGATLGRYLDLAGVPRARSNWGDTLFRKLRHSVSVMEVWTTPVVMVETHALLYYQAIRRATKSPLLRRICEQILTDEVPHLRFQSERFAILFRHRAPWLRRLTLLLHRALFAGVTAAVWAGHHRALRAGGYSWRRFWRSSWTKMQHAWRMMDPGAYAWPDDAASANQIAPKEAMPHLRLTSQPVAELSRK